MWATLRLYVLCVFSVLLLVTHSLAQRSATSSQKQLSEGAKRKISATVANEPDSIFVFDSEGNIQKSVKLTEQDKAYESMEQFIQKSDKSPVDSCKNPKSIPPPPCILCNNGEIVCSEANFGGRKKVK